MKRFLVLLIALLCSFSAKADVQPLNAEEEKDTLAVSLITCAPGAQVYELYGHTALRVHNVSGTIDAVFNYGMFSFETPHFVWRFLKGDTDYYLGVCNFSDFLHEYLQRGSDITEQTLNLTSEETKTLAMNLGLQAGQRGWTYRYNFLYDNCTTRARNEIERAVKGKIVYPTPGSKEMTYRTIIHEYTKGHSWDEFGQDLLLGAEADCPITWRQQQFAPFYMKKFAGQAYIMSPNGEIRPLVVHTIVLPAEKTIVQSLLSQFPFVSPTTVCLILFVLLLPAFFFEIKKRKVLGGLESSFLLLQGIMGCIIFFMVCFSSHPTVGSNWLIVWLNPLPLIYLPLRFTKYKHKWGKFFMLAEVVLLGGFLLFSPWIPQYFSCGILLLALLLFIQYGISLYLYKTKMT